MKRIIQRVAALVIGLGLGAVALAGLESVTHISDLNISWPLGSDLASTSDDHIRNIKVALKTDFPNITGPVTVTQAQLNAVGASGVTGAANPSASLGLSAINGSATTFMRSDAAPALSQAISPTWTAGHTFAQNASSALTVRGDLALVTWRNTATTAVMQAGSVNGWIGSGGNVTDAAIGANGANLNFYVSALSRAHLQLNQTALTFGNTTDNPTYSFLGTGQSTFTGTIAAKGDTIGFQVLNTSGTAAGLFGTDRAWTAGGLNTNAALGAVGAALNVYVANQSNKSINITQSALNFGNTTDNQNYSFLGSGTTTLNGKLIVNTPATGPSMRFAMTGASGNWYEVFDTTNAVARGLIGYGAATFTGGAIGDFGIAAVSGALRFSKDNGSTTTLLIDTAGLATFSGAAAVVGGMVMGAPTGGNKGAGTLNAGNLYVNGVAVSTSGAATTGTFTGTVTGMTAGTTGIVNYSVTNNIATMWVITAISGTSNVGTMTMTGLPAAVQPSNPVQGVSLVTDTGATAFGAWRISGSTVTFQLNAASAFTTSGTKGILGGWTITYPL